MLLIAVFMDLTSQLRDICFMAMSLEKVSKINIKQKYSIKYENLDHFGYNIIIKACFKGIFCNICLVRKNVDVNEHGILFTFSLRHKVKEQRSACHSTFHNHNRVFNNDHIYPK